MTTYSTALDDVTIGEIDDVPFRVSPRYRGTLSIEERLGLIASSIRFLVDAVRYDSRGAPRCTGEDCSPAPHDVLTSYRREASDVLYLSLNFGYIPNDMPEFTRAIGRAVGIDGADIERLIEEMWQLIMRYVFASGILVTGGRFIFDETEEDDEALPTYISWIDVTRARYRTN